MTEDDEDDVLDAVRRETDLDSTESAREVTLATLTTLGERITDGQAGDLAAGLPDELSEPLAGPNVGEAEAFDLEKFLDRVSDRADVERSDVPVYTAAVFETVARTHGDEGALAGAREQLPPAFDVLFEPGELLREEAFLAAVEERTGLSTEEAREAIYATLETLSESLTGGQAADLAVYVPPAFAETLADSEPGEAAAYSIDGFVERVAERTGAEGANAEIHARAVLDVLSEAASDRELENARKQLPDPFGDLFELRV